MSIFEDTGPVLDDSSPTHPSTSMILYASIISVFAGLLFFTILIVCARVMCCGRRRRGPQIPLSDERRMPPSYEGRDGREVPQIVISDEQRRVSDGDVLPPLYEEPQIDDERWSEPPAYEECDVRYPEPAYCR